MVLDDSCCRKIAGLLCQGAQASPRTLPKLVEKTGLARSTVLFHLKHLEADTLLIKEEILQRKEEGPRCFTSPQRSC